MKWNYFVHLVGWALPVVVLQWAVGWRIFLKNARAIVWPTLIGGSFFTVIDMAAVKSGIWFFDPAQNLGIFLGPLPIEEVLFFFLTSLLVAQSLLLFLPAHLRR